MLVCASKCRKMHLCNCRISKISTGTCPRTPLEGKAQRALQTDACLSSPDALLPQILMKPLPLGKLSEQCGGWKHLYLFHNVTAHKDKLTDEINLYTAQSGTAVKITDDFQEIHEEASDKRG